MSERVYRLRHMFQGMLEDQTNVTFFTRDNEHLLAQLPAKVLAEAEAKGWIDVIEVPTVAEQRAADADLVHEARGSRGGAKPNREGNKR